MNPRVVGGAIVTAIAIAFLHLVLAIYFWLPSFTLTGFFAPTWDHLVLVALLVGWAWWGMRWRSLARWLPLGLTVLIMLYFLLGVGQGFALREFGYDVVLALHIPYVPALFKMLYDGETFAMFLVYVGLLFAGLGLVAMGVLASLRRVLGEAASTRNRRVGILAGTAAYAAIAIPLNGIHGPVTGELGRQIEMAVNLEEHLDATGRNMTLETAWMRKRNPFQSMARPPSIYFFVIESYGHDLWNDDDFQAFQRYARKAEARLGQAGYTMRSRYLTAPVFGGSSWMADTTLLCGVRVHEQRRFEALHRSNVACLPGLLNDAGYRTILASSNITFRDERFMKVMPFQTLYYRDNLEYKGPRFTWSYMPDQYTIHFVHEKELAGRGQTPTLMTFVLTSSHHPWSKIPRYVADWSSIGDGSIFAKLPAQRFRNTFVGGKQVEQAFAMSIEYTFQVVVEYLLRGADDNTLMVVIGDHQPRHPIADMEAAPWDVPVHVLSRNPALVEGFAALGYTPGLTPNPEAPQVGMEGFLLHLFKALAPEAAAQAQ